MSSVYVGCCMVTFVIFLFLWPLFPFLMRGMCENENEGKISDALKENLPLFCILFCACLGLSFCNLNLVNSHINLRIRNWPLHILWFKLLRWIIRSFIWMLSPSLLCINVCKWMLSYALVWIRLYLCSCTLGHLCGPTRLWCLQGTLPNIKYQETMSSGFHDHLDYILWVSDNIMQLINLYCLYSWHRFCIPCNKRKSYFY